MINNCKYDLYLNGYVKFGNNANVIPTKWGDAVLLIMSTWWSVFQKRLFVHVHVLMIGDSAQMNLHSFELCRLHCDVVYIAADKKYYN